MRLGRCWPIRLMKTTQKSSGWRCSPEGRIDLLEHATIESYTTSLMFLPNSILAAHLGGMVHTFSKVHEEDKQVELLSRETTFEFTGIDDFSYDRDQDMVVGFVCKVHRSSYYAPVTFKAFFRDTRIMLINREGIDAKVTYKVSPGLAHLLIENTTLFNTSATIFKLAPIIPSKPYKPPGHFVSENINVTRAELKVALDSLQLLPACLGNMVADFCWSKEFFTKPELITQFSSSGCPALFRDRVFFTTLDEEQNPATASLHIPDIKAPQMTLGVINTGRVLGVYPGLHIVAHPQTGLILNSLDEGGMLLKTCPLSFYMDTDRIGPPSQLSNNGLVCLVTDQTGVLLHLKTLKNAKIICEPDRGSMASIGLNQAGTLMSIVFTIDYARVYRVQCDLDRDEEVLAIHPILEVHNAHSILFLKDNVVVLQGTNMQCLFYSLHDDTKGDAMEQLREPAFDSRYLVDLTYYAREDIVVAFVAKQYRDKYKAMQVERFFRDTRILILNQWSLELGVLDTLRVSPDFNYLLVGSGGHNCYYLYRISNDQWQSADESKECKQSAPNMHTKL